MTMDDVDTEFETTFRDKYQEHAGKIGRFNLAIFGKTGVGKSTLINAVFGSDVAATGIGQPVTMEGHLYLSSAGFLGLYDTRGIEIGNDSKRLLAELEELVDSNKDKDLHEQIHAVWYCVNAGSSRIEPVEADFIRRVHDLGLPIAIVVTQVRLHNGSPVTNHVKLAQSISALDLPIDEGPILVMAQGDDEGLSQHGLQDLLDATFRIVPEAVEDALIAAQQIDLQRKRTKAGAATAAAVMTAGGIGAVPIPVADAVLLVPLQLGLIAAISAIYGIKRDTSMFAAAIIPTLAPAIGKAAAAGLIKLIPGAGSIVGGIISAGVAGVFTGAMGYAWSSVCEKIIEGGDAVLDGAVLTALFNAEFLKQFTKLFKDAQGK